MNNVFCYDTAIIGNSPSELDTNNGIKIDGFKYIIRFNQYKINNKFKRDYGSKITHWCHFRKQPGYCGKKFIFNKEMNKSIWKLRTQPMLEDINSDIAILFPDEYYIELQCLLHSLHNDYNIINMDASTGACMLFWMYKKIGKLNKENIFGFNFFNTNKKHHYCDGQKFHIGHNGVAEKMLFDYIIK